MHILILTDILEMLGDSLGDTDLTDGDTQGLHEFDGIVVGAVGSTETWHRNTDDSLTIEVEFIERLYGNEQSQRGVESAADTNHGLLGIDMIESFGKTCHLDIQNLLAGCLHILVLGDKRMRIDLTFE